MIQYDSLNYGYGVKMNIGLDIDGVLNDAESFVIEYGQRFLNKYPVNYAGDDIAEVFGVSQETEDAFWNQMIHTYATCYPARSGASTLTRQLRKEGHRIVIITNRCRNLSYCDIFVDEMKQYIKDWLNRWNIEYDEIVFNTVKSKLSACLEHHIDVMIEDSLKRIEPLLPYMPVICYKSAYNENSSLKGILYAENMDEVYHLIQKIKEEKSLQNKKNTNDNGNI